MFHSDNFTPPVRTVRRTTSTAGQYASSEWRDAKSVAGVRYEIVKVSLARRAEITRRVRSLLGELEYHGAGSGVDDRLAAAEVASRVDRVYVEWGLLRVEGLEIDGEPCGVAALVERGPEELSREIAAQIRRQCRLSDEERKN
jgi:hypothetical protein